MVPVVITASIHGAGLTPLALASEIIQVAMMAQPITRSINICRLPLDSKPAAHIPKYPTSSIAHRLNAENPISITDNAMRRSFDCCLVTLVIVNHSTVVSLGLLKCDLPIRLHHLRFFHYDLNEVWKQLPQR